MPDDALGWKGDILRLSSGMSGGAPMFGRLLRKLVSLLFMALGAMLVSGVVDSTPGIGSPQIDRPGLDVTLPFWPQLVLSWVIVGGGSGLLTSLGMLAWSDQPPVAPKVRSILLAALLWFAVIGGVRLATFSTWGTMGPLGVHQPVIRFALTNGFVSAGLIVLEWVAVSLVLSRMEKFARGTSAAVTLLGTGFSFAAVMVAIALSTRLPLQATATSWWPAIAILALSAALLVALLKRNEVPAP